ncbi:oxidoreductase [Cohnella pontilimi]|uniref:Oxidoreductase n=1 Tax=Cohnella pontilimi TaxID=2564100 RepID=A0A4U0FC82_9BACL|nr:oxidoreductase [Cohnella pontilimi]TJY40862.1 oxidoreductase [Cohnella pontilimi]
MESFEALVADQSENQFTVGIRRLTLEDLPAGELLIEVAYSSVNYKDALACIPNGNIVKTYPFVPGIDLAGIVVSSEDGRFQKGDEVIVTSYELGVSRFGGFSQYARVPSAWAVKRPAGLSLKESMILGTAGFTAALSVHELERNGVAPDAGPVLVTGASGGVGSMAVAILSRLGYEVTASTGKTDMRDELVRWGAAQVVSRDEWIPEKPRPLDKQRWAAAVDCVGGKTLSAILSSIRCGGAVAASGLTGGAELATTVFPFILRAVKLIGIDSANTPMDLRRTVWERLAAEWKPGVLESMYSEISLDRIPETVTALLQGQSRGRFLVKV